jgi:hypothetical protein
VNPSSQPLKIEISQRASPERLSTAHASSCTPSELNASLPCSGPLLNVNLERFGKALNRLPVGELHEACRQRYVELLDLKLPITYAQLEAASARLETLSDDQRITLVKSFFKTHQENPVLCPFPRYHETIVHAVPAGEEDSQLSKAIARSILESGMAPFEDVKAVAFGVAHSLLDSQRDLFLSLVGVAGAAMLFATVSTLSGPTIIAASLVGLIGFRYLAAQPNPHNEACAGYVRENLDFINAVLNYEKGVCQLGASLNIHYNNPNDRDNYGSLWRASGFLLARAARIVGASNSLIEKEFRKLLSIKESSQALTGKINSALTEQEIAHPCSLLAPFMEEGALSEQREQYLKYLDEMNYCYISWAASEARILRGKFVEAILACKNDDY